MSDSLRMRRKNPQDTCLTGRGLQERKGRWALLHSARAMVFPLHTGAWCPPPPPATLRCLLPFTSAFSSGAALAEAQLAQRKGGLGWNQDLEACSVQQASAARCCCCVPSPDPGVLPTCPSSHP